MPLPTFTRVCEWCKSEYQARRQSSRYCGGTCRALASRLRTRDRQLAQVDTPEPAPEPAPAPEPVDLVIGSVRECEAGDCSQSYTVARVHHFFCSPTCGRRAWRKRKRAAAP